MDDFWASCGIELQKMNSGFPIYRRIAEVLRKLILDGVLPQGSKLPPESECAEHFEINLRTLRKSFKLLSEQGLLSQCRGRGTFVAYAQQRPLRIGMLFLSNINLGMNSYHAAMLYELFRLTERHQDCELTLLTASLDASAEELQKQFLRCRCDGVICFVSNFIPQLSAKCFDHFPLVFFNLANSVQQGEKHYSVHLKAGAIRLAFRYFLDQGIRNVRYFSSDAPNYEERNKEFARVRKNYKLKAPILISQRFDLPKYRESFDIIHQLFAAGEIPRAFVVANAKLAVGVYHAVLQCGLRIPEDVAIVGFDINRDAYPGCYSLCQPVNAMLEQAVALLQAQRSGTGKILHSKQYFFPVSLLCD